MLKIPLPICNPTTRLSPLQNVTVFSFSSRAWLEGSSAEAVSGNSMSLYENEVVESRDKEDRGDGTGEMSSLGFEPFE